MDAGHNRCRDRVGDIELYSVNVLDRDGFVLTCEIEFEAPVEVNLEADPGGPPGYGYSDHWRGPVRWTETSIHRTFSAEIIVNFNSSKPDESELISVRVDEAEIELDLHELGR